MKRVVIFCMVFFSSTFTSAEEVKVAVASNFAKPFESVAKAFTEATGYTVVASPGSTGKLYAQIKNGAPFEVFLAADSKRPEMLAAEGLAQKNSLRTYAVGRLVLWSSSYKSIKGADALREGAIQHIALANPKTAPYGAAAVGVLKKLGMYESVEPKLVIAENIAQTFQFIASGNAEIGFVAFSQLKGEKAPAGSFWLVPAEMHEPIEQAACLLNAGASNPAALALINFLASEEAAAIIVSFGYRVKEK